MMYEVQMISEDKNVFQYMVSADSTKEAINKTNIVLQENGYYIHNYKPLQVRAVCETNDPYVTK